MCNCQSCSSNMASSTVLMFHSDKECDYITIGIWSKGYESGMSVNMHMNGSPLFPSRVFAWTGLFKCQYLAPSAQSQLPLKRKQPAWRCRTLKTSWYDIIYIICSILSDHVWSDFDDFFLNSVSFEAFSYGKGLGASYSKLSTKPKAHHPDPPIGVKALALGVEMQALKEIEHESNEQLRQKMHLVHAVECQQQNCEPWKDGPWCIMIGRAEWYVRLRCRRCIRSERHTQTCGYIYIYFQMYNELDVGSASSAECSFRIDYEMVYSNKKHSVE